MPEAVERPAPVRTTTERALRQRAVSSSSTGYLHDCVYDYEGGDEYD